MEAYLIVLAPIRSRSRKRTPVVIGARTKNGVEDDAVVKRKVEPPDLEVTDVDARWRSSNRRRGSGVGDSRKIDGGFRRVCPVVSRPPPLMAAVFPWDRGKGPHGTSGEGRAATTAGRLKSLDNDRGQDVGSRGAEYTEYGVVKEEKQRTVTTLDNGAATVEGSSATARGDGSDYAGVLHGNAVAKGDGEPRTTNRHVVAALSSGRNLCRGWLCRASPIAAKPPPLMAAVFPWNRGRDDMAVTQGEQERRVEEK
ncbi:hypothetical protein PIB30_044470, partial [Stylosanthes scabra]|nr:hypothetical protein [Stylosanthes scabra]